MLLQLLDNPVAHIQHSGTAVALWNTHATHSSAAGHVLDAPHHRAFQSCSSTCCMYCRCLSAPPGSPHAGRDTKATPPLHVIRAVHGVVCIMPRCTPVTPVTPHLVGEEQPPSLCSSQHLVAAALQHTQAHTCQRQACQHHESTARRRAHGGVGRSCFTVKCLGQAASACWLSEHPYMHKPQLLPAATNIALSAADSSSGLLARSNSMPPSTNSGADLFSTSR